MSRRPHLRFGFARQTAVVWRNSSSARSSPRFETRFGLWALLGGTVSCRLMCTARSAARSTQRVVSPPERGIQKGTCGGRLRQEPGGNSALRHRLWDRSDNKTNRFDVVAPDSAAENLGFLSSQRTNPMVSSRATGPRNSSAARGGFASCPAARPPPDERRLNALCRRWRSRSGEAGYDP